MKKKKLAIFDIDGTIFRKNLAFELVNELVYMKKFPKAVRRELTDVYRHWLENEGTYEAYRRKLVKLYQDNLKGCQRKDVVVAAKRVASFNAKRIYIFARDLIGKLRKDHVMLIISGSPVEIVKEYAKLLKFDDYYGSVYEETKAGIYTGKEVFTPVKDKGRVVKQYIAQEGLSLHGSTGIGDTESDAKFLELMDHPIAFNPNSNLRKIAEKKDWKIVVEKKDVIYEL